MAILSASQRSAELARKASLNIKPTDSSNTAQYNAIVAKNNAVSTPTSTPSPISKPTITTPTNTPTSKSGISSSVPSKPYTEGANSYTNDGTNIYKNNVVVPQANYKYIPTEIGGLRGAGTSVTTPQSNPLLNSIGAKTGVAPTTSSAYDWNKLTSGGYDTNKEFGAVAQGMIGADRNKYMGDQQALTLYDYMNGQKDFGGTNKYGQIQYSNNDKRYENDISRGNQTMMLLSSQLGKEGFNQFAQSINGKTGLEITKILNDMGMKGVDVNLLQDQMQRMNGINGITENPLGKNSFIDWAGTTNINGEGVLQNGLNKNYSVKPDGSIDLNDMLTNVNGQQMHIFNALKYGTGENAQKDLYANMLANEKRSGGTEAIPLKARAELAPETMTPQMKMDYQEQLQIEDMLSKQIFVLEQINQMSGSATQIDSPSNPLSDLANATGNAEIGVGAPSGYGGGIASGGLAGGGTGASGVSGGQGDMSGYNFTTGQGQNATTNVLDGLTPEQINQMNAILQKMNGFNK